MKEWSEFYLLIYICIDRLSLGSDRGKDYGIFQAVSREEALSFLESVRKYFGS